MPEFTQPGVHVEERSTVPPSIAHDRAFSLPAFVGPATSGPFDTPTPVTVLDFAIVFGAGPVVDALRLYFDNGGDDALVVRTAAGAVIGSAIDGRGVHALGETAFGLLVLPGTTDAATLADAAAYAAARRAFVIADAPLAATTAQAVVQATAPIGRSPDIAVYTPWLDVAGRAIPASGAIAGAIVSNDRTWGVWHASAGITATITGGAPHIAWTDADQGILNPAGINAIRCLPRGNSPVIWGARTLVGADGSDATWRYVPVRRLALLIERNIVRSLKVSVFEPNAEPRWARFRHAVELYPCSACGKPARCRATGRATPIGSPATPRR